MDKSAFLHTWDSDASDGETPPVRLVYSTNENEIMKNCMAFNEENRQLRKKLREVEKRLGKVQEDVRNERAKNLFSKLKSSEQHITANRKLITSVVNQKAAFYLERRALKQRMRVKEREIKKCREFTTDQTIKIEKLENKQQEELFEIDQISIQLEGVQTNLKNEKAKNQELNTQILKLQAQLNDGIAKNSAIHDHEKMQELENKCLENMRMINQLSIQIDVNQQSLKVEEIKNVELVKEIEQLQIQLNNEITKASAIQVDIDSTKWQLETMRNEALHQIHQLMAELEVSKRGLKNEELKNVKLMSNVTALHTKLGDEISLNLSIQKKFDEKRRQFEEARRENLNKINQLSIQLGSQENLKDKETIKAEFMKQIEQLQTEMKEEIAKAQSIQAILNEKKQHFKKIQLENLREIHQLKNQLQNAQENLENEETKSQGFVKKMKELQTRLEDEILKSGEIKKNYEEKMNQQIETTKNGSLHEISQLSTQLEANQQYLKKAESKYMELIKENKQLRTKLDEEIGKSFAAQACFDEKMEQFNNMHIKNVREITQLAAQLERHLENLENKESKNKKLVEKIEQLQIKLENEIAKNDKIQMELHKKENQFEDMLVDFQKVCDKHATFRRINETIIEPPEEDA